VAEIVRLFGFGGVFGLNGCGFEGLLVGMCMLFDVLVLNVVVVVAIVVVVICLGMFYVWGVIGLIIFDCLGLM